MRTAPAKTSDKRSSLKVRCGTDSKTVPVAIQIAMQGAYGATDYGGFMAMLVLAIIPIIIFYLVAQRYIISGVISGAVKG